MDYGKLQRFALRHGSVSIIDSEGVTRSLATSESATHELIATAKQFLWDGLLRSRAEMEPDSGTLLLHGNQIGTQTREP